MASTTPLSVPRPAVAIRREQEAIEAESHRGVVTLRKNFDKNATQRQADILIKLIKDNWENVEIRKVAPKPFTEKGVLIEGNDILVNIASMQCQLWTDMTYTDIAEFHTFISAYKQYGERNEYPQLLSALKSYFLDLFPEKQLPPMVDWATPENTTGLDVPGTANEHDTNTQEHPVEDVDTDTTNPAPTGRTTQGRKAAGKKGPAPAYKRKAAPKPARKRQPRRPTKRYTPDETPGSSDNEPLARKRARKVTAKKYKKAQVEDAEGGADESVGGPVTQPLNDNGVGLKNDPVKVEQVD